MLNTNLVKKPKVESATEVIRNNLDLLNLKYQVLVDNLYHRLQQLSDLFKQEEPSADVSSSTKNYETKRIFNCGVLYFSFHYRKYLLLVRYELIAPFLGN